MTELTATDVRVRFPDGIPGFDAFHEATLRVVDDPEVQGVYAQLSGCVGDDFEVTFLLARPQVFFPDYSFEVGPASPSWGQALDLQVWVVLTQTGGGFTANLRAPILLDVTAGEGAQLVLDESYPLAQALV